MAALEMATGRVRGKDTERHTSQLTTAAVNSRFLTAPHGYSSLRWCGGPLGTAEKIEALPGDRRDYEQT
jgi:hypothetical protein